MILEKKFKLIKYKNLIKYPFFSKDSFFHMFLIFFSFLLATIAIITHVFSMYSNLPFLEISLIALLFFYFWRIEKKGINIRIKKYQILAFICIIIILKDIILGFIQGYIPEDAIFMIFEFCLLIFIPFVRFSKKMIIATIGITIIASILFLYEVYAIHYPNFLRLRVVPNFNIQAIGTWGYLFCVYVLLFDDIIREYYKNIISLIIPIIRIGLFILAYFLMITTFRFYRDAAKACSTAVMLFHYLPEFGIIKKKFVTFFVSLIPGLIAGLSIFLYILGFRDSNNLSLLNNREWIWIDWLKEAFEYPLIGKGWMVDGVYTHNSYIDFIYMWGIPFLIIFIIFFYNFIKNAVSKIDTRLQYDAYIAFILCLTHSSTESMYFFTGDGLIFLYMDFLMIIIFNWKKNKK